MLFNQNQIAASKIGSSERCPQPSSWLAADKIQPDSEHHADQSSQQPVSRNAKGIWFVCILSSRGSFKNKKVIQTKLKSFPPQ